MQVAYCICGTETEPPGDAILHKVYKFQKLNESGLNYWFHIQGICVSICSYSTYDFSPVFKIKAFLL